MSNPIHIIEIRVNYTGDGLNESSSSNNDTLLLAGSLNNNTTKPISNDKGVLEKKEESPRSLTKTASGISSGISTGAAIGFDILSQNATLSGNAIQAQKLDRIQNTAGLAATVGLAAAMGNPIMGAAVLAFKTYSTAMENRTLIINTNKDNLIKTEQSKRLVEDTTKSRW